METETLPVHATGCGERHTESVPEQSSVQPTVVPVALLHMQWLGTPQDASAQPTAVHTRLLMGHVNGAVGDGGGQVVVVVSQVLAIIDQIGQQQ